jgi:hypothetical protein
VLRKAGSQKISNSDLTDTVTTKRLSFGGTDFGPLKLHIADYAQPAGTGVAPSDRTGRGLVAADKFTG